MKNLLVLTGGVSAEREVSIKSAKNLIPAIDQKLFHVIEVSIERDKTWLHENNICHLIKKKNGVFLLTNYGEMKIDLAFPIVLGDAESGELMGFFASLGVVSVGSDVLSSAICYDKIFNKIIAQYYGIKIVPFIEYFDNMTYNEACNALGTTELMVKNSQSGSSLGAAKAHDQASFEAAVLDAKRYGNIILIERFYHVREFFCSVYEDCGAVFAAPVSEVFFEGEVFTYEKKNDPTQKQFQIPANLPAEIAQYISDTSIRLFKLFRCSGYVRIDWFLDQFGNVYYSEINTIPGSSEASSFMKMLEVGGISKQELMEKILRKYV